MKRLHVFEFEDFSWFPEILRNCMTRYILLIHKLLKTNRDIINLIEQVLIKTSSQNIIDLCSGSGGPMINVVKHMNENREKPLELILTDMYPNKKVAKKINEKLDSHISYLTHPVDATDYNNHQKGIRTMICSMHHFAPDQVRKMMNSAAKSGQPFIAYEISDNSIPNFLWWVAIPINILMVLFLTPMVRPFSLAQLVFTYLIPLLPFLIAWDGAVSNVRTYTLDDMMKLIKEVDQDKYRWEPGVIDDNGPKKLYLLGCPVESKK